MEVYDPDFRHLIGLELIRESLQPSDRVYTSTNPDFARLRVVNYFIASLNASKSLINFCG